MPPRTTKKQVYLVNAHDARCTPTISRFLADRLTATPATVAELLRRGSVYVDGRRQREPAAALAAGQRVIAFVAASPHELHGGKYAAQPGGGQTRAEKDEHATKLLAATRIAYRDRELAVIVKPAGLPSTTPRSGAAATAETFVAQRLGPAARLLHRLDQGASGLLLVSCRRRGRAELARQLAEHRLERSYLAVVVGAPSDDELVLSSRLAFDGHRARSSEGPGSRPARCRARLLRRAGGLCLLQVELETGRTHQIRAQLAEVGLPLAGDDRYGDARQVTKNGEADPPGAFASRLALHAHRLVVKRSDGRRIELHCPLPEALARLVAVNRG